MVLLILTIVPMCVTWLLCSVLCCEAFLCHIWYSAIWLSCVWMWSSLDLRKDIGTLFQPFLFAALEWVTPEKHSRPRKKLCHQQHVFNLHIHWWIRQIFIEHSPSARPCSCSWNTTVDKTDKNSCTFTDYISSVEAGGLVRQATNDKGNNTRMFL